LSITHGSQARVYANGFDLSTFLNSISSSTEVEAHDSTTFTATAKTYIPGLIDATLSAEGLFSGAVGATDAVFFAALRDAPASVWCWLPIGDIDGSFGYGMNAFETNYSIESPVDGLVAVSVEAQSIVGADRVQILAPLTARTVTGNGTSRDNTILTTAGGVGYLQVTAFAGTSPTLTVRIQHSVDNSVWVDLITFTAVGATVNAQRMAITGTVNRWTRAIWTIGGTAPSYTLFEGFTRN